MFQFYRYLHAKHAIHHFDTKFLGWELYVHMYSNVHIQKHSSKKQIRFFPLLFTTGGTVETRYDRTEKVLQYCFQWTKYPWNTQEHSEQKNNSKKPR